MPLRRGHLPTPPDPDDAWHPHHLLRAAADGALPVGEGAKAAVRELYEEAYRGEPFVRVVPEPPQTKHTWGNNLCLVYPTVDVRAGRLVVVSCIDNLVKGAAGQAIQT